MRLREDYSAEELRALARRSKVVNQSRRLLSLAAIRDGVDRGSAAKIGGMDRHTLRDWVHRFNAAGPEGLLDNWTDGLKPRLSAEQLAEFAALVEAGPGRNIPRMASCAGVGSTSSASSLSGSASSSTSATSKSFSKKLGFSHISARPRRPAQDERIVEAFKKTARARCAPISTPCRKPRRPKSGFQDEARIARRMARFDSGPSAERGLVNRPTSATTTPICSSATPPARLGENASPSHTGSLSIGMRQWARWSVVPQFEIRGP